MGEERDLKKKENTSEMIPSSGARSADKSPATDFLIVAVGASAGGFEAFQQFLQKTPAKSGIAFVFITHLDPTRESLMVELLAKSTDIPVQQVKDTTKIKPDNLYVIPPNKTLTIKNGILKLQPAVEKRGLRLPIDNFFLSLAEDQNENAVAVILSGSGSDGTIGVKAIKENGGVIFVQEIETAKYDSMPRNAILTGLVDFILPVAEIPAKLVEYNENQDILQDDISAVELRTDTEKYLEQICNILQRKTGHDFSNYKKNTLIRRIRRRLHITQSKSVGDYISIVEEKNEEAENLFKDLLVSVTHFFRDQEAFEKLRTLVIPKIIEKKSDGDNIRIWVPGCATGEEAYTIAMLFCEQLQKQKIEIKIQMFATDIDEKALETARTGRYPKNIEEQIPEDLLEKHFIKNENSYLVKKNLREMCIFSPHNLIKHPPFSRLDLISCRNLLIYLDSDLQKRIFPVFHYSLSPEGFLFLGSSESIGSFGDLFKMIDKSNRIFRAKDSLFESQIKFPLIQENRKFSLKNLSKPISKVNLRQQKVGKIIENIILESYSPACVIINERHEIIYYFGKTGNYLEATTGKPTNDILVLAKKGVRLDLRTALHKAVSEKNKVLKKDLSVLIGDLIQKFNLIVRPIHELGEDSGFFAVIFQDVGAPFDKDLLETNVNAESAENLAVQQIENELRSTKEHLQTTIEELETSNEELKSSNEELLSMNEELQSSNEEMQTSKEEMQSINEELETVNVELTNKIEELDRVNSDLQNLFQSTKIATIFLDAELRIQKFTPAMTGIFRLIETDTGRPITDIMPHLREVNLSKEVKKVLHSLEIVRREVAITDSKEFFEMTISPYRTIDNVIDGVVITFINITDIRNARRQAEQRARQQSAIANLSLFSVENADLKKIFNKAVDLAHKILEVENVKILQLLPNEENLLLVSGIGWQEDLVGKATVGTDLDSQAGFTLRNNAPIIVKDLAAEERFSGPSLLIDHNIVSGMSVVIHGREKAFGIFGVHSTQLREFTKEEANFLQSFANIVGAAVERDKNIKALKESQERLNLALTTGKTGVWEWLLEEEKILWNDIQKEIFGIKSGKEEITFEEFWSFIHPDDSDNLRETIQNCMQNGDNYYSEFRIKKAETNETRWLIGHGKFSKDSSGKSERLIGVNYDITERKKVEAELREADRRKNDFLAMLGHELRNPLAPLQNSLTLLQKENSREQRLKLKRVMERQVKQMSRLVDDLLDVSRIAHGKVQLHSEAVNLTELLEIVLNDFQPMSTNKNLNLDKKLPETEIWIKGDEIRLTQAIGNLLTNAMKFSRKNSRILVELEKKTENAVVTVSDQGIGMSKEAVERIFENFSQENHSIERSDGGLGLGLPVAKGLIELHGGTLTAESAGENLGSTFKITLPVINAPKTRMVEKNEKSAAEKIARRILIIEDNVDSAETLKILLELSDHTVEICHDGQSGIEKTSEFKPDVVICDIGLPGKLDGFGVAAKIRENQESKEIFLIALSGYGLKEDVDKAIASGFNRHLVKPPDFDVILKLVQNLSN